MELISAAAASTALLAGVLAAFNPCGFALLPAYITVIVTGSAEEGVTRTAALRRAVGFGLAMTLGFVAVFLAFGALFAGTRAGLQGSVLPYVSWITLVIGAALIVLGVHLMRGGEINVPGLKLKGTAPTKAFGTQVLYGAGFAIASLSCTIGPFLGVVAVSLAASNPISAGTPFIIYGIGMGTSVLIVSMLAAVAGSTAVAALRRRTPLIMRIAGVLMVLVGAFVTLYGLAEVLQQTFRVTALDWFLRLTGSWQGSINQAIASWGTTALVVLASLTAIAVVALFVSTSRSDAAARAEAKLGETPKK